MIETHPFGVFSPPQARYLILGSFPAFNKDNNDSYDWFYGSKRNQFWPILEEVYNLELRNKQVKQALFTRLSIAIADIIYQCERLNGSSLDVNLTNCVYNKSSIKKLFKENSIEYIFFTSRFVEKEFKIRFNDLIKKHPNVRCLALPSPSPRYVIMGKREKIERYKEILPKL